jgi:protein-L-isoaspartate(D-aspartate) O-methyltransferase
MDATSQTIIDDVLRGGETPPEIGLGDRDPLEMRLSRAALVRKLSREVGSRRVLEALYRTPRHLFVSPAQYDEAYADRPLPIGHGQTISQPTVVALMTEALELSGKERVLEIGTGSAWQGAILALLTREVFTIERVAELAARAERRLIDLGLSNVHVRFGDGYLGWPEGAPFDRVVVTAAPEQMPGGLVEQLDEGGIIVAPIGTSYDGMFGGYQSLQRCRKKDGDLRCENLGAVAFVPMLPGAARFGSSES